MVWIHNRIIYGVVLKSHLLFPTSHPLWGIHKTWLLLSCECMEQPGQSLIHTHIIPLAYSWSLSDRGQKATRTIFISMGNYSFTLHPFAGVANYIFFNLLFMKTCFKNPLDFSQLTHQLMCLSTIHHHLRDIEAQQLSLTQLAISWKKTWYQEAIEAEVT